MRKVKEAREGRDGLKAGSRKLRQNLPRPPIGLILFD